jgi:hypothetical protein
MELQYICKKCEFVGKYSSAKKHSDNSHNPATNEGHFSFWEDVVGGKTIWFIR